MAWCFELAAEVGADRQTAERLKTHFVGLCYEFPDGRRSCVMTGENSILQDSEGNFWCLIYLTGANYGVYGDERIFDTEEEFTTLGNFLYDRLRTVRGYRYARAGLEVEFFATFHELLEDLEWLERAEGLVLSEDMYNLAQRPSTFVPFSPGYYWNPYKRERLP